MDKDDSARTRAVTWNRVSIVCSTILLLMGLLDHLVFDKPWTTGRMIWIAVIAAMLAMQVATGVALRRSKSSQRHE